LYIYDPDWNVTLGSDGYGDHSWNAPVTWGTSQSLFIEDNTMTFGNSFNYACIDGYRGTRTVVRFNIFTNCRASLHGTESSLRNRGSRAAEIYQNTFTNTNTAAGADTLSNVRSGSALIWGNTGTNVGIGAQPIAARLTQDRTAAYFTPFGGADGTN